MKIPALLERYPSMGERVYGEPYQTADGATVITVARVRTTPFGRTESPIGVCVIRGGHGTFVSALDVNVVPTIAISTGLAAAVITTLALLRRPPWPDLRRA